MSFDLAVWEGPRPVSDEAAAEYYAQIMDRMEPEGLNEEPTARIRGYVDALLARWPDITTDAGDDSPWADGPMIDNAFGDAVYFSMVWSRAEESV